MRWLFSKLPGVFSKKEKLKNDTDVSLVVPSKQPVLSNLSTQQLLKIYFDFIFSPENRAQITAASALTVAITIFTIVAPYYFGLIIASITDNKKSEINSTGEVPIPFEMIGNILFSYFLYRAGPYLSNIRNQLLVPVATHNSKKILRDTTYHLLSEVSLDSFINNKKESPMIYLQRGNSVSQLATPLLTSILPKFLELFIASATLSFNYGAPMGLGVFAMSVLFTAYCTKTAKQVIDANQELSDIGRKSWGKMESAIDYYKEIYDCGKSKEILSEIDHLTALTAEVETHALTVPLKIAHRHNTIADLCISFMLLYQLSARKISVADFAPLFGYLIQLASSLPNVGEAMNDLISKYPNLKFVFNELKKPSEVIDYGTKLLSVTHGANIKLRNIRISNGNKAVMHDGLSLTIESGKTVAIVGPSGCGKSTVIKLLYRYVEPTDGCVLINGQDISEVKRDDLQKNIIMIGQKSRLLPGTVRENIIFGAKENTTGMSDGDIFKLVKKLNLFEFICSLSKYTGNSVLEISEAAFIKGLDADSAKLSGGEQQQVSILRGFAKEAPIRLLDEITSALDPASSEKVMTGVKRTLNNETTTVIVTHRLTEITFVDEIFVLENGRVNDRGTHEELLERCALYRHLWEKHKSEDRSQSSLPVQQDALSVVALTRGFGFVSQSTVKQAASVEAEQQKQSISPGK